MFNLQLIPLPLRRFLFNALAGAVLAIGALNLAIPGSLTEAKAEGLIVFSSVVAAVGLAFVRSMPDFIDYVLALLQTFLAYAKARLGV